MSEARKLHSAIPAEINPNVRGLQPSATLAINERSRRLKSQGKTVYRLGFGQSPFPVPEDVVEALRGSAHQNAYLPSAGLPALRDAVAGFHRRRHDIRAEPEDVFIGPGSKELMFLLQLVCDCDLILPSPSWVSYAPQAGILGRRAFWLQTAKDSGWRVSPDGLDGLCLGTDPERSRILVLNYPGNPTGMTYDGPQLEAIARTARRHGLIVLSDEIYAELHHTGRHVSIARFYPEGTIVSSGLSKWCGAGGWRLGTFIFPKALRPLFEAMTSVATETFSAVSAPIQYAAVQAYRPAKETDGWLAHSRRILRALGSLVSRRLRAAEVEVDDPEGAFYLFPDFCRHKEPLAARGITTSPALCDTLLNDTGVVLLPGSDFGRPEEELTARLSYVDFDGSRCLEASAAVKDSLELSDDFLCEHCGNVVTALELIAGWLNR